MAWAAMLLYPAASSAFWMPGSGPCAWMADGLMNRFTRPGLYAPPAYPYPGGMAPPAYPAAPYGFSITPAAVPQQAPDDDQLRKRW